MSRSKGIVVEALQEMTGAQRVLWRPSAAMLAEEGIHTGTAPSAPEACLTVSASRLDTPDAGMTEAAHDWASIGKALRWCCGGSISQTS